jgi:hypothetical protein
MQSNQKTMSDVHYQGHDSLYLTIMTVFLYFISKFTLSDVAAMATVLAAVSTAVLNVFRFLKERKERKNDV